MLESYGKNHGIKRSSNTNIRVATEEDLDAIIEIENKSFTFGRWSKSQYQKYLNNKKYCFGVLTNSNIIIGFFLFYIGTTTRYGHVYSIAVADEYRRYKYGTKIMSIITELCHDHNRPGIKLEVAQSNIAAIRLYEKLNFSTLDQIKNYYGFGLHAIRMKCKFC